jgi:hypothetical protein
MNLKMFTIVLILLVLTINNIYCQKPTTEMLKSEIICGNISSGLTLENLESYFKQNGNEISYEIYNNKEVILITKKMDNLLKKSVELKFQFEFISNNGSVLIVKKGLSGKDIFTAEELCNQIIMPLGNNAIEDKTNNLEKNLDIACKKCTGIYTGSVFDSVGTEYKISITINYDTTMRIHGYKYLYGTMDFNSHVYTEELTDITYYNENKVDFSFYTLDTFSKDKYILNGIIESTTCSGDGFIKSTLPRTFKEVFKGVPKKILNSKVKFKLVKQ